MTPRPRTATRAVRPAGRAKPLRGSGSASLAHESKNDLYQAEVFDEGARNALSAAHATARAEALEQREGRLGPEHVLLSLVRQRKGGARLVLRALGIHARAVRARLRTKGLKRVQPSGGRIVTAAGTKRVIEFAVLEAKRLGDDEVRTEHLLIGILSDPAEPAAQVLSELGVTKERAGQLIGDSSRGRPSARPPRAAAVRALKPRPTGSLSIAWQRARAAALKEGATMFRSDHLMSQLLAHDCPTPALLHLLRAVGTDLEELRRRLRPPRRVTRLEEEIQRLSTLHAAAVGRGDTQLAGRLFEEERVALRNLVQALADWNAAWARLPVY